MNAINTSDLRPGQVFSEPVFTEGKNMLVSAMVPLRQKDIDVLVTLGVEYVKTSGSLIDVKAEIEKAGENIGAAEALRALEAELAKAMEEEAAEAAEIPEEHVLPTKKNALKFSISDVRHNSGPYRAYKSNIEKLNSIFNSLKAGRDTEMRVIDGITDLVIQDLRDFPDKFVGFILGGEVTGLDLAKSSVNAAILSALTAQELQLPAQKMHNVVSGALLHDVGMLRLSKGITEKKGGLSEAELEQIKSHPLHTSKIVTKELFGPSEVNSIALHHHERWDGKGYPDGLTGNAIDVGARIVSVADAFEAMICKKSYRNSMTGYQAIKNLMADNGRRFDPAVIIAFTKVMGIYPIGSIVRLNDSSIARVVNVHSNAPMRPVVQMLTDEKGNVLSVTTVTTLNLLEDRTRFIKEAIDPAEYMKANG
ncbi:MAG: HD-GYP domain-containing protein [Treponema sp.]|nr:HD-GYP domain-containing protein [Treponema sp.]MCL2238045.1 HD-GYP domain-containing protein [Treponema sp.]